MRFTTITGAVALVATCVVFSACSTTVRHTSTRYVSTTKSHGPPPHAPAHGYRHKHGDAVLVYDSTLEVYLVSGHPNCYYHRDHYYRTTSSGWEIAVVFEGPWRPISTRKLPKELAHSVQVKNNKKHKK